LLGDLNGLEIGTLHAVRPGGSEEEDLIYMPARPEDDPQCRYFDTEMGVRLTKAINDLLERERLIMTLYYYEETAMTEIGLIVDVAESRVSQMHVSAVLHLRARLSAPATIEEHDVWKCSRNESARENKTAT
jgi:RNA polymerase sigma factor for flagellar operon FliA